ncbi:MAG: cytochrome c [Pseudomonadota bacterium]|nr:cytochrome c [Pseudomonadota bacterium]
MGVRPVVFGVVLTVATLLAAGAIFVWSGVYNVAADAPHTRIVHQLLQTLREQSVAARADDLVVPDLSERARIVQGSGNYDAMCKACHLAPGMGETELSRGLNPAPPMLTRGTRDAARAFWVVKHGIKATGMPAWGESMQDEYIWNMVAFLQQLPSLDADEYKAMVASSGGHEHGGGETTGHAQENVADSGDGGSADARGSPAMVEHRHADGTVESHPVPRDDGHDHEH